MGTLAQIALGITLDTFHRYSSLVNFNMLVT